MLHVVCVAFTRPRCTFITWTPCFDHTENVAKSEKMWPKVRKSNRTNSTCRCTQEGVRSHARRLLHLRLPPALLPPRRSSMCLQVCWAGRESRSAASWYTSAGSCPAPADSAPLQVGPSDGGRLWRSTSSHLDPQTGRSTRRAVSVNTQINPLKLDLWFLTMYKSSLLTSRGLRDCSKNRGCDGMWARTHAVKWLMACCYSNSHLYLEIQGHEAISPFPRTYDNNWGFCSIK